MHSVHSQRLPSGMPTLRPVMERADAPHAGPELNPSADVESEEIGAFLKKCISTTYRASSSLCILWSHRHRRDDGDDAA